MKNGKAFELDLYPRDGEVVLSLSKEVLHDVAKALVNAQPGRTRAFAACHAMGELLESTRQVLYGHMPLEELPLLQKALTDEDGKLRMFEND